MIWNPKEWRSFKKIAKTIHKEMDPIMERNIAKCLSMKLLRKDS